MSADWDLFWLVAAWLGLAMVVFGAFVGLIVILAKLPAQDPRPQITLREPPMYTYTRPINKDES